MKKLPSTKRILSFLAAFAVVPAVMVTTGGTATAETYGCPSGAACVLQADGGGIYITTYGNWYGNERYLQAVRIVNNGNPAPGADHIDVTTFNKVTKNTVTFCAHHPPAGQTELFMGTDEVLKSIEWRGEC